MSPLNINSQWVYKRLKVKTALTMVFHDKMRNLTAQWKYFILLFIQQQFSNHPRKCSTWSLAFTTVFIKAEFQGDRWQHCPGELAGHYTLSFWMVTSISYITCFQWVNTCKRLVVLVATCDAMFSFSFPLLHRRKEALSCLLTGATEFSEYILV
jgi:hypothetical protein